jgi:hypothetical protein
MKKEAIHSILERSPLVARHYPGLQKIAKTAETGVGWVSNDDVIENFDFKKLARSNEVTGDFDVGLGWSRLTTYAVSGISGVMPHLVLCRM